MKRMSLLLPALGALLVALVFLPAASSSQNAASRQLNCDANGPLCAEPAEVYNYESDYIGHDEPSVLFYSNTPGSGNSTLYRLSLPVEPPTLPKQDGSGGTFTFQDRIAFWFGMALCEDQSGPNPGGSTLAGAMSRAHRTATPTSTRARIPRSPGTSVSTPEWASSSSSSTRPAG